MSSIKSLKITTLADNLVMTRCLGQWGLSFFLELTDARGDPRKIIFDTGVHKDSWLYNVKQLRVDLSEADCLVISHGHGDHTAAIVEAVEAAGGVKVYAHPHTFQPRFAEDETGRRRRYGVPEGERLEDIERVGGEVVLTSEPTEIVPGVWTTGQVPRITPFEHALPSSTRERRIIVVDGQEVDDQILDDQALWMDVRQVGPFVITGCAHSGLLNTLLQVKTLGRFDRLHGLVGGTHLVGRSDDYLQLTISRLSELGLRLLSPCHCTGFKAAALLWRAFPAAFFLNFAGRVIDTERTSEDSVI